MKTWFSASSVWSPLFLEHDGHVLRSNTVYNGRQGVKIAVFRRIITQQMVCGEERSHFKRVAFSENLVAAE